MRPRSRLRPERVRPRLRPNDLASRPHGPRGLNIPVTVTRTDARDLRLYAQLLKSSTVNRRRRERLQ